MIGGRRRNPLGPKGAIKNLERSQKHKRRVGERKDEVDYQLERGTKLVSCNPGKSWIRGVIKRSFSVWCHSPRRKKGKGTKKVTRKRKKKRKYNGKEFRSGMQKTQETKSFNSCLWEEEGGRKAA